MGIRIMVAVLLGVALGWLAGPFMGERAMDRILARAAVTDGWTVNYHLGAYEGRWLLRSIIARVGLGALVPEEALYYRTSVDVNGEPLSGDHVYTLSFEPDDLPPALAFWSLTAYDVDDLTLVDNPIGRYQIGDRTPGLLYQDDGALVIVLSAQEPLEGPSNWLPVPQGPFDLVLRGYEPDGTMLSGAWGPSPVCLTAPHLGELFRQNMPRGIDACTRMRTTDGEVFRLVGSDQ